MFLTRINVRESGDSRNFSHHVYDDTECITRDSKEELLAECYSIRQRYEKEQPAGAYDSGMLVHFFGPIEVVNNGSWTSAAGETEYWFEDSDIMNENQVSDAIDTGAVLHQIMS